MDINMEQELGKVILINLFVQILLVKDILENGVTTKQMVKESICGILVIGIWEIGQIFSSMAMVLIILQTEINILESIDMANHGEKVNTFGNRVQPMKETLMTVKRMVMVVGKRAIQFTMKVDIVMMKRMAMANTCGQVAIYTADITRMIKDTSTEKCNGMTVAHTKENGLKEYKMVMAK